MLSSISAILLTCLVLLAQADRTVDVFVWPLSASKSHSLAQISYNSTHASVKKYTPPKLTPNDDVVRIGFYHPSGAWSGVSSAASNFASDKHKKVQLFLNTANELYHVGFKVSEQASSSKTGKAKDGLGVEVVKSKPGPMPRLNKPVVLNEQGQVPEKEVEKTFVQKYWWIIIGVLVVQIVAAASGKD